MIFGANITNEKGRRERPEKAIKITKFKIVPSRFCFKARGFSPINVKTNVNVLLTKSI